METTWMYDRMRLYRLMQNHPDWSIPRLAAALQRSVSWVKKWRRRFREARAITFETFLSRSRAPKTSPQKVWVSVVKVVLSLRKTLGELYHQRVGPKRILYHLREDTNLEQNGHRLPRSATTVWRILRDAGVYPCRERVEPISVPRPEPMSEIEQALEETTDMVLLLSDSSMPYRKEVHREWFYYDQEQKPIKPLYIQDCKLHSRLYTYNYTDARGRLGDALQDILAALFK